MLTPNRQDLLPCIAGLLGESSLLDCLQRPHKFGNCREKLAGGERFPKERLKHLRGMLGKMLNPNSDEGSRDLFAVHFPGLYNKLADSFTGRNRPL